LGILGESFVWPCGGAAGHFELPSSCSYTKVTEHSALLRFETDTVKTQICVAASVYLVVVASTKHLVQLFAALGVRDFANIKPQRAPQNKKRSNKSFFNDAS
jgi:hypothetical protein